MRWISLLLLVAGMLVFAGCRTGTAHDRLRHRTYRQIESTNERGVADDVDAVLRTDRPTHLSPWFNE